MSYTDPCKGDCGADHWPDCSSNCSSRKPVVYSKEQKDKKEAEKIKRREGKKVCNKEGHVWEYVFIIDRCKRCGETTDY